MKDKGHVGMNLRINGRKIIENKRLITPSRSVENVVVDKYNQYKKADEQDKKTIKILCGLGAIALVVGATAGGMAINSAIKSNSINDALAEGANNSIGDTKDALANAGVNKLSALNEKTQAGVVSSIIGGSKIKGTSGTFANFLKQKNVNEGTFAKFLNSPTFTKSKLGSSMIKNATNIANNKIDPSGLSASDAITIFNMYEHWRSMR